MSLSSEVRALVESNTQEFSRLSDVCKHRPPTESELEQLIKVHATYLQHLGAKHDLTLQAQVSVAYSLMYLRRVPEAIPYCVGLSEARQRGQLRDPCFRKMELACAQFVCEDAVLRMLLIIIRLRVATLLMELIAAAESSRPAPSA